MGRWTTSDIPDSSGRTAIVTGANTGLGFSTARELARAGAHVFLACRTTEKGASAAERIIAEVPKAWLSTLSLELGSLTSIRNFVTSFSEVHERLDILVNNAGIMMTPHGETEDGFELQIGVNHLGHFALTLGLLPILTSTPGARVVNVSSLAHRWGPVVPDDLFFERRPYSPREAYGQSKLANLLFTRELQRRLAAAGHDTLAVAAHPGVAMTDLFRGFSDSWYWPVAEPVAGLFLQSADMGALPQLRAATDPSVMGDSFWGPGGFRQQRGHPVEVGRSSEARDDALARSLWLRSQELTGMVYG